MADARPEAPPDLLEQSKIEPLPPRVVPLPELEAVSPHSVALTPVSETSERPAEPSSEETAPTETLDVVGFETPGSADAEEAAESVAEAPETGAEPDMRSLLALTPLPASLDGPIEFPLGQMHGSFAISTEPHLDLSETEPGSGLGEPTPEAAPGDPGEGDSGSGISDSRDSGGIVSVSFGPQAAWSTAGAERGEGGSGSPGLGSGPGAGAGPSSARHPFAGISVIGGIEGGTGIVDSPSLVTVTPAPVKTSYNLFVVSTESGGGGLPSFGVFSGEQVYTVFLDMRETEFDTAPRWTFQFAAPPGPVVLKEPDEDSEPTQQGFVFPFPAVKKWPELPRELVRPHLGQMVIVYGVINLDGCIEELTVKESPEPGLNEPVFEALREWVFRPAVLDGRPVAAKVLLGIPLWLPR